MCVWRQTDKQIKRQTDQGNYSYPSKISQNFKIKTTDYMHDHFHKIKNYANWIKPNCFVVEWYVNKNHSQI
jgi:hypothetical protein